jgi:ubiquinone biosynthesis protein UbiJ
LLQDFRVDFTEGLANLNGDTNADELLEASNVGNKISVQVVRVQR